MRVKNPAIRKQIVQQAKTTLEQSGPEALNIRTIASECGISTGTVYNYFENKQAILFALTEDLWSETLHAINKLSSPSFFKNLEAAYFLLSESTHDFRGSLLLSMRQGGPQNIAQGKMREHIMIGKLQTSIENWLLQDPSITVWSENFTPAQFSGFILSNLMSSLTKREENIHFLLQICQRVLTPAAK